MGPINKSLIANFSGKETSFFFKISPKVVFCTTVPEYGHNSICQKSDLTTFVSQVFKLDREFGIWQTQQTHIETGKKFCGIKFAMSLLKRKIAPTSKETYLVSFVA